MLRLALLRLPRPRPTVPPSRACYVSSRTPNVSFGLPWLQAIRRHASTSTAEEVKRDPSVPASDGNASANAQTTNVENNPDAKHQDTTSTTCIPPSLSPTTESSTTDSDRTQTETVRGSSEAPASQRAGKVGTIDVDSLKGRLRLWSENAIIAARERVDLYTISAIKTFAQLGRELNKVTGYGEIENLKKRATEQEARIKAAREAAREAKLELEKAVQQRQKSQREVNDLLSRKSTWSDDDVGRFTALVRKDHLLEQAETRAKERAVHTEDEVDREFTELMRVILNRYHEEQIWSDKIRSASTYGSLTVMGLNMLVFILAIIIVEPWKRRRLAQTFENKVEEMSAQTVTAFEDKTSSLSTQLQEQQKTLSQLVEVVTYSMQPAAVVSALPPTEDIPALPYVHELPLVDISGAGTTVSAVLHQLHLTSRREQELAVAVATTATVAGVVGWFVRSWVG